MPDQPRRPSTEAPFAPPALTLPPEEMRALGYRVVDMLVEHLATVSDRPVSRTASRAEMEARLREPAPEQGAGWAAALERARGDVFGVMSHIDHPRCFAYVPSPGNFVGAMADALVAGLNPFAGAWAVSPGAAQVELVTVDWLREMCGMPAGAGGAFVSGGSMANLTALAVARHARYGTGDFSRAVVYCSDQTHTAVDRGMMTLGFAPGQLRRLPSDAAFRLSMADVERAMDEDAAAGREPFCVVGNAGTTSTGAVDPLRELAALARARGAWLHVDGAYGAPAALTDSGRALLDGMGEADSLTLDPHKWLFQPIECGALLVRDAGLLRDTFRMVPAYLRDSDRAEEEVNFRDRGVQLTRSLRALKLWLSIQAFGMAELRRAVRHGISLAETAEAELRASAEWEVLTPAQLAVITFRWVGAGDEAPAVDDLQRRITAETVRRGHAMLSTTEVGGRVALRLCTINPRTTPDDVRGTIRELAEVARTLSAGA